jgi:hypothetical protein
MVVYLRVMRCKKTRPNCGTKESTCRAKRAYELVGFIPVRGLCKSNCNLRQIGPRISEVKEAKLIVPCSASLSLPLAEDYLTN